MRYIIALFICLIPFTVSAAVTVDGATPVTIDGATAVTFNGVTLAAGGGGAWVYSRGSDDMTNTYTVQTLDIVGDDIVVPAGSLTKVSVKLTAPLLADTHITAFHNVSGTWTMVANGCCTIAGTATEGWNDCTLTTPYTTATNEHIRILYSGASDHGVYYAGATGGMYYHVAESILFCSTTTPTIDTNDYQWGVRAWVQ